LSNSNS